MAVVPRALGATAAVAGLLAVVAAAVAPAPAAPKALPAAPSTTTTSTTSTSTTTTSTTTTTIPPPPSPPPPPPPTPQPAGALCIGDSVLLGAGPIFGNTLSMCAVVDATENRQYHEADDVAALHYLAGGGVLPHTVVVALGNNGYTTAGELESLLAVLVGVPRVVLVTVQLQNAREWQGAVNAEIRAAAARHPSQVVVADWETATAGHPELFAPDGIHISSNPAGAAAFAATIAAAL
jgi:hypothetical protein